MRHFKFKVEIYEGPENMFNYTRKGEFFTDDEKSEEELREKVKIEILTPYERDNMISEIKLKETPII